MSITLRMLPLEFFLDFFLMAETGEYIHPIVDTNTKNVNIELAGKNS